MRTRGKCGYFWAHGAKPKYFHPKVVGVQFPIESFACRDCLRVDGRARCAVARGLSTTSGECQECRRLLGPVCAGPSSSCSHSARTAPLTRLGSRAAVRVRLSEPAEPFRPAAGSKRYEHRELTPRPCWPPRSKDRSRLARASHPYSTTSWLEGTRAAFTGSTSRKRDGTNPLCWSCGADLFSSSRSSTPEPGPWAELYRACDRANVSCATIQLRDARVE